MTSDDDQALFFHVPDRAEMTALLRTYFDDEITERSIDMLVTEFDRVFQDRGALSAHDTFFCSPTQWRGMAWNEDFSRGRRSMTPSDLVLMLGNIIADTDPTFPRPKLFCPPQLVGTWRQVEPSHPGNPYLWTLAANGAFTSNSSDVPGDMRWWCAERIRGFKTEQVDVVLRVAPRWGSSLWTCNDVERVGDELVGVHVGYMRQLPVRLRLEP